MKSLMQSLKESKLRVSILISVLIAISACSHHLKRTPSQIVQEGNLELLIDDMETKLSATEFTYENCHALATYFYQAMFSLSSKQTILSDYEDQTLSQIITRSFAMRTTIREKLIELDHTDLRADSCIRSVRDITRALRYLEDYIVEHKYADESIEYVTLTQEADKGGYFLKGDPSFDHYSKLQSGDVILSRGNAYTSAAIARIGDVDAQFSHLSFVYIDDNNKAWTIEAHIEIGAVVAPLDVHIDQKNARTVVFRYQDQEMAHQAAKEIFNRVKRQSETGKNIEYDFGMDYHTDERLFCSEVVYQGFQYVTNNKVDIPIIKTKFNKGLIPFLNKMGIKVNHQNIEKFDTFSPGDIEFDHRFKLIAEWRNPNKLHQSRKKDAILTKMFEWMEKHGYEFRPKIGLKVKSNALWLLRRIPVLKKLAEDKFPTNMKVKQLKLFLILDTVGDKIMAELEKFEANQEHKLTPAEMYQFLDKLREDDKIIFNKKRRKSIFHRWFRSKKKI